MCLFFETENAGDVRLAEESGGSVSAAPPFSPPSHYLFLPVTSPRPPNRSRFQCACRRLPRVAEEFKVGAYHGVGFPIVAVTDPRGPEDEGAELHLAFV